MRLELRLRWRRRRSLGQRGRPGGRPPGPLQPHGAGSITRLKRAGPGPGGERLGRFGHDRDAKYPYGIIAKGLSLDDLLWLADELQKTRPRGIALHLDAGPGLGRDAVGPISALATQQLLEHGELAIEPNGLFVGPGGANRALRQRGAPRTRAAVELRGRHRGDDLADHCLGRGHALRGAHDAHDARLSGLVDVHLGAASLLDVVDLLAAGADEAAGARRGDLQSGLCVALDRSIFPFEHLSDHGLGGGDVLGEACEAHQDAVGLSPIDVDLRARAFLQLLDASAACTDDAADRTLGDLQVLARGPLLSSPCDRQH
mmetsp:Transcript_4011/g.14964  ORF Transcript_4011/g.14964 Transcript_4011/m.14964 type:complete len:316 (+) Transcript_4011:772-1719(+)